MLKITDLVQPNQQHIFTAEQVEEAFTDTQKAMEAGFQVPEPVAIYRRGFKEAEPAFIVRRGAGPHKWVTKGVTALAKACSASGARLYLTQGEASNIKFFKAAGVNISRNFPRASRKTLTGVSNLPVETSDRISHHIFQIMEVTFDESQDNF